MASKSVLMLLVLTLAGAWTAASVAQGTAAASGPVVRVEYVHPEKFTDVGDAPYGDDKRRAAYLDALREHVVRRAAAALSAGQRLTVTITNVDMAGGFEPLRRHLGDTRIVRDVYPPRIDLGFRLTGTDGAVIKEGERKLRDLAFLMAPPVYRNDPLRFEKALLDDWLARELPLG